MAYYVVDGHAVESCGDAVGMPDFTAWVPPEHAHMDDSHASNSKAI